MSTDKIAEVAVITGVSRREGIGFEVARQLGHQGMTVVVTARDAAAASQRAAELRELGVTAHPETLDVSDADQVAAFARRMDQRFGRVDVLVNNAAATSMEREPPSTADLTKASAALEVTLFGPWRMARALLPLLRESPHPRIVNVSSGAGSHSDPAFGLGTQNAMGPAYAVGKAALNALTVLLANELKPAGLLVNAVCPGFTATFPGAEAMGARPVADGARSVVWAALLPDDGPTAGFFRDGRPIGW